MSKTIEEILAPKPEARPRIYAYSIDDTATQSDAAAAAEPQAAPYSRTAAIVHSYNCIERGMIRRSCPVRTSSFAQECGRRVEATVPARKN